MGYFLSRFRVKWKIVIVMLVMVVPIIALSGCSIGGIGAPKNISFVKQSNESGRHIWLETGDENNISKNNLVWTILVLNNKKLQAYQIFDDNITLGQVSKMNDREIISLAKKQDKKYATTGAIKEVRHFNPDREDDYIGLENDLKVNEPQILVGKIDMYYRVKRSDVENHIIKFFPSKYNADEAESLDYTYGSTVLNAFSNKYTYGGDPHIKKAVLWDIKKTPYQMPQNKSLSVQDITDDSGNEIIAQKVTYASYDMFNSDKVIADLSSFATANKATFQKLVDYSKADDSEERQNKAYDKLLKGHYDEIMKGYYGYNNWNRDIELSNPVSQQIYKKRYIGYVTNHGSHLLTVAQNKSQEAVLSK